MKICFPVKEAKGFESEVYEHFGSAPFFVMADIEGEGLSIVGNSDQSHAKGMCSPIKALGGSSFDGIVVSGIGAGALMKLNSAGITVYRALAKTIGDNIKLLKTGQLPVFSQKEVCSGHRHNCAH